MYISVMLIHLYIKIQESLVDYFIIELGLLSLRNIQAILGLTRVKIVF